MKRNFSNIIYTIAVVVALNLLASCDAGFDDLNQNPDAYSEIIPEFLFTKAQLDAVNVSYFGTAALTIGGSMQQFATYKEVPASGDKYFNDTYSTAYFTSIYPNAVNEIKEIIVATSAYLEELNKLSADMLWLRYIVLLFR